MFPRIRTFCCRISPVPSVFLGCVMMRGVGKGVGKCCRCWSVETSGMKMVD